MGENLYNGKTISLKVSTQKIKGRLAKVERIIERNIVVMLPLLDSNTILLERQYRPVLKKYIYELPAGHIDEGETPRQAAIREMQEETGSAPKCLSFMYKSYSTPGSSSTIFHYFVAIGLANGNGRFHKDPDEVINIEKVSMKNALSMIKSGRIIDNKTISAILYYKKFLAKG